MFFFRNSEVLILKRLSLWQLKFSHPSRSLCGALLPANYIWLAEFCCPKTLCDVHEKHSSLPVLG
jgi:hypothetical protein